MILFDNSALHRTLEIDMAQDSSLLLVEPLVFGRAAMNERLHNVHFKDRITIRRNRDLSIYGEEGKFGGGKVIRDGMGQSLVTCSPGVVDTVIANARIVDYTGIYMADVALKDRLIHAIGKAGNPDTQPSAWHIGPNMNPRTLAYRADVAGL